MYKIKEGSEVMIYHDPITMKNEEGKAILLDSTGCENSEQIYCKVRFLSDGYVGYRWISTSILNKNGENKEDE